MLSRYFFVVCISMMLFVGTIFIGCKDNSTNYNTNNNGGGTQPDNEIWMQNISFNPSTKTVSKGTKLTWVNKDSFAHTVTSGNPGSPDGSFDSGNLGGGGSFSYTFNSAGTFKYYCKIHGSAMIGTITVQ